MRRGAVWIAFAAAAVALGVLAAWPIYQTAWLLVPAAAGLLLGAGVNALSDRRGWSAPVRLVAVAAVFALTVVPVAMPQSLAGAPDGLLPALADGLAAVVLGWKQLLTLTLPVGAYQTVLVPAYVVFLAASLATGWIAQRAGRLAPAAAAPLLLPVAFGTVFGAAQLSPPLRLGPVVITAPRELALWVAAAVLGAVWVAWIGGAARRAALGLGRAGGSARLPGRALRLATAAAMLVLAVLIGVMFAPALSTDRVVPRDRIDPVLVVAERPSPLAGYRAWKSDALIDATLFSVAGDRLPGRLRLAVLDEYTGVEFQVGADAADRFTRFPSGPQLPEPAPVIITIDEGYTDIWAPMAQLGGPPEFFGPRAELLADAFYVNRATAAAIAVPGERGSEGFAAGDAYRAVMSVAPDAVLADGPASPDPLLDLETMPELASWIRAQAQPATDAGLAELIDRLRARGYLSHAMSGADSEWILRLAADLGTRFEPSVGGHSTARLEELFAQLNAQQRAAGDRATPAQLVAAAGDDEQFAAAAALLARALGYESRVVVGVRLADGAVREVPGVPACTDTCRGEHLAAWIEVRGESGVWAPLDATPQASMPPSAPASGEQMPEFPTTPEERDAREVDPPLGFGERSDAAEAADPAVPAAGVWPVLRAALLAFAALVLLALPALFLPVAKRLRARARRRASEPEVRALGAWQELLDRAADAGVELPADRRGAARAIGTDAAAEIAAAVDRAVFAPEGCSMADADRLWRLVDEEAARRRAELSVLGRLREAFALRSVGIRFARRGGTAPASAPRRSPRRAPEERA